MTNILICFHESSFISIFDFRSLSIPVLFQDFAENEKDSPKNSITEKFLSKIQSRICFLDFAISSFKSCFKYSKSQKTIFVNFKIFCFDLRCLNIGYNDHGLAMVATCTAPIRFDFFIF